MKAMTARILSLMLLALGLLAPTTQAQFWEKKEWKQWSKEDAQKMLEDSPWARTWSYTETRRSDFGQSSGATGREPDPKVFYAVQLRSAAPIRQAVARQMQLQNKYEKMPDAQKKQFDESVERFLAKQYDDVIVVHVMFGSNVQFYERDMMNYWKGFAEGSYPVGTFLNAGSQKIAPVRFVAPPGGTPEFEFIFPRTANGEEIITPQTKSIFIEFTHPGVNTRRSSVQENTTSESSGTMRVVAEFKIEKMSYKGSLSF
jgi:hypothetical protein